MEALIHHRYKLLEVLGIGGMGAVYRALDRLTGSLVAVKRLDTPPELLAFMSMTSSSNIRLSLAREFEVLASLRHPHIISVLDYGFAEDQRPYLVMEHLAEASSIVAYGRTLPFTEQIRLLLEMLEALNYLHRRGVIHRDLKPDNVMVCRGQVKVLDFGLSTQRHAKTELEGTIAYLAPELWEDGVVSEAADLYAVGIIACELLTGKLPFIDSNLDKLFTRLMNEIPDLAALGVLETLRPVIAQLLAKNPHDRPASARTVMEQLAEITQAPLPENPIIRDSYLESAQFLVRETELAHLIESLHHVRNGQGKAWLVSGESGIGKSRLLDELRTHALLEGMTVLRGQAVEQAPFLYQIWREPLRWLVLSVDLSDSEAQILKALIPDIDDLIGRPIAEPARHFEANTARRNLIQLIVELFYRYTKPLLLLVEDLHWTEDDLEILHLLLQDVAHAPLMIVGSYRHDERSKLGEELGEMELIRLNRLDRVEIAQLAEAMIGEAGNDPTIVDFLARETEGNLFFLVEVMRVLAEEAGQLAGIGRLALPQRVMAGGMQTIIQRRLARMPHWGQPLLQFAAVAGRNLDEALLNHFVGQEVEIDIWLNLGAECAILAAHDNLWQFAHDKLRESILEDMDSAKKTRLHRHVAEAIAEVYPANPIYYAVLAYHWGQVGAVDAEIRYKLQAGIYALHVGAYADAKRFLEQSYTLHASTPTLDNTQLATLQQKLGEVNYIAGDYSAAQTFLTKSLVLQFTPHTLRKLGNVEQALGNYDLARGYYEQSIYFLRESGEQLDFARAMRELGVLLDSLGENTAALECYAEIYPIFEALGDTMGMAGTLSNMGILKIKLGLFSEAESLFQLAVTLFDHIQFQWGRAFGRIGLGQTYFKQGQLATAYTSLQEAVQICTDIGHPWGLSYALKNWVDVELAQGEWAIAQAHLAQGLRIAQQMQAIPLIVTYFPSIAQWLIHLPDAANLDLAFELIQVGIEHPASDDETKLECQAVAAKYGVMPIFEVLRPPEILCQILLDLLYN